MPVYAGWMPLLQSTPPRGVQTGPHILVKAIATRNPSATVYFTTGGQRRDSNQMRAFTKSGA